MRTLKFWGASDDLCEIKGTIAGEPDEFGPDRSGMAQVRLVGIGACPTCGQPVLGKMGVIVTWQYTRTGTWSIGVAPLDPDGDDTPLDWPMRWGHEDYTTVLQIDVPDGTTRDENTPCGGIRMNDALRIVKLEAENIKALRAVEITPDGNLVEITGRNGQGKSSVLDSIWWALAGASAVDPVPIRTGETEARIRLDLGEIVVTRFFTERENGSTATKLTVATAEGANYPSPQALLDGLLGALAFDPLAFSQLPARNQYEQISSMVGLDFTNDDNLNRADFDARTELNRTAKSRRAVADMITVPADTPDEPVSVGAIVTRIRDAEAGNRELESERGRREGVRLDMDSRSLSAENLIKRAEEEVCRALEQAVDLIGRAEAVRVEAGARADRLRLQAAEANAQADEAAAELAALPPLDAGTDTAAMQEQVTEAEEMNAWVRSKLRKVALLEESCVAGNKADALTDRMEQRRAKNRAAIEAANMPVDGLGMADGALTLRGIPLVQASDAEKLDVSCVIAMRQNARMKVLRIRDGSRLDRASKARIAAMAAKFGWQVWMERVDESGVGIVIEAGEVANAAPPRADLFDGEGE